MASPQQVAALQAYARRVREARRANPTISEPGLAPEFQRLLEALLPLLSAAPVLTVSPEFTQTGVGRPDIALKRPGQPARAFVELKSADKPTDGARWRDAHDKRQFARFSELANWAVCNFHDLRRYERGESVGQAALVPEAALDPARSERAAERLVAEHDPDAALRLLERLAQADQPAAANAEELAELLAYSARLVREIVRDRLAELQAAGRTDAPLQQVRQEFREVLYAHPEAAGYSTADFDMLFSGAFAQTLAFGLLLVREATGEQVDRHAADHMPPEHPLMRTALRVLSLEDVARDVGAGFEVMLDTVNSPLPSLAIDAQGRDPILYFYEFFLETFDPAARERYGVYYTPVPVVRYMVGALDRVLRERLETQGIADEAVHILDPATGTGTFLLGIADRLRRDVAERDGPGQVAPALQGLARRMYGFELLIGPYAVAHYRLHHALSRPATEGDPPVPLPRLGVYLTDTLAQPGAAAPAGRLGFVADGIRDERVEANRIKSAQPILAIIGNPPYKRLAEGENRTLVGDWMDGVWDDLKAPVRDAGQGGQLNTFPELSVAFWRWALWKLFEAENAPRRGVVAFISNRKFLTGWPYAGLRAKLRDKFDRIEVLDLRGDSRRGERAGVVGDQNVFDIQVGVAITLAIADGTKAAGSLAEVAYTDAWALDRVSREAKLNWLLEGEEAGWLPGAVAVERDRLEDMRPLPFQNGGMLGLREFFHFSKSGMKSGDDPTFVQFKRASLQAAVSPQIAHRDNPTYLPALERELSYRPLDRRWFFNDRALLNRPGPEMQRVWGADNVALYALPSGTGAGPSVWCRGMLPDYHAFKGSYGGYAFPLYDRRPEGAPINLKADLVARIGETYAGPVTPEAVFDVILCLLSAASYTTRFAEDLEDVFPHVPIPGTRALFDEAAACGAEIRAVETFARPPGATFTGGLARSTTTATGPLAPVRRDGDDLILCADGSGRIGNVPEAVWRFSVSGYLVLQRWLAAREGQAIGPTFIPELRDVAMRIAELIDLFARADGILVRTLEQPLSREGLDAAPADAAVVDEDDDADE